MLGRFFVHRRPCSLLSPFPPGRIQHGEIISVFSAAEVSLVGEMCRSCFHGQPLGREIRPPGKTLGGNLNFIQNILGEYEQWERQRSNKMDKDFVHFTLKNKNIFVTITDDKGNKKLGASAGCLKEIKGGSRRRTKYAVEATTEHVGRAARNLGVKSVVVRVKGSAYFGKKKAAIASFRKGLGYRSAVTYIQDVTQLPHNGCRLPKRRRA